MRDGMGTGMKEAVEQEMSRRAGRPVRVRTLFGSGMAIIEGEKAALTRLCASFGFRFLPRHDDTTVAISAAKVRRSLERAS